MTRAPGAGWRPTERQLQPLVQGALNRHLFRVLPHHWLKEVHLPRRLARGRPAPGGVRKGARLDLVAFVHRGSRSRGEGVHVVEVKMADDRDAARLDRQLGYARLAADYAWLAVVDGEPRYDPDPDVGLLRYDLPTDRVTVVRRATRIAAPPFDGVLLRAFADSAAHLARRAEARLALGKRGRRRAAEALEAAPVADAPWEAEDPWEPALE